MAYTWTKAHKQYYHSSPSGKNYRKSFGTDAFRGTKYLFDLDTASAREQMDFQNFMSSTAHQREVQDLVASGLNPVLSANGGAQAGAGASASSDSAITNARIQQEMQKKQLAQDLKIANNQIKAQKYMNKYSTDLNYQLGLAGLKYGLQTANINASATRYASLMNYSASKYNADAALINAREQREYDATHNIGSYLTGMMSELVNSLLGEGSIIQKGKKLVDGAGNLIGKVKNGVITWIDNAKLKNLERARNNKGNSSAG